MDPIPPSEHPEKAIKAFSPLTDFIANAIDQSVSHAMTLSDDPNQVLAHTLDFINLWFAQPFPLGNTLFEAIEEEVQKRTNNKLEWKYQTLPLFYFED